MDSERFCTAIRALGPPKKNIENHQTLSGVADDFDSFNPNFYLGLGYYFKSKRF